MRGTKEATDRCRPPPERLAEGQQQPGVFPDAPPHPGHLERVHPRAGRSDHERLPHGHQGGLPPAGRCHGAAGQEEAGQEEFDRQPQQLDGQQQLGLDRVQRDPVARPPVAGQDLLEHVQHVQRFPGVSVQHGIRAQPQPHPRVRKFGHLSV